VEVAVKLLQSGMTLMQVAELTGLSVDHVKELMKSI
jgi:predicted HTH domain antitoxin